MLDTRCCRGGEATAGGKWEGTAEHLPERIESMSILLLDPPAKPWNLAGPGEPTVRDQGALYHRLLWSNWTAPHI